MHTPMISTHPSWDVREIGKESKASEKIRIKGIIMEWLNHHSSPAFGVVVSWKTLLHTREGSIIRRKNSELLEM